MQSVSVADPRLALRPFRDRMRIGGLGPAMIAPPLMRYVMGAPLSEPESRDTERPMREIRFAAPFAMGRRPISFDEYERFTAATGHRTPSDEGWGRGRRPVINVSWRDAEAYCAWLSEQTGAAYRLPSEAEWEYVCRAGRQEIFATGARIETRDANYDGGFAYNGSAKGRVHAGPTEVGAFPPNPWGYQDLHGNVWEWCADDWNPSYAGAPCDGAAWRAGDRSRAVARGGSWLTRPVNLRSAARGRFLRSSVHDDLGFRVARTA